MKRKLKIAEVNWTTGFFVAKKGSTTYLGHFDVDMPSCMPITMRNENGKTNKNTTLRLMCQAMYILDDLKKNNKK